MATVVIAVIAGFWAALKFREYLKDKRFKTYHELIDDLVNEQRQPDRTIKLDRQIAIIFELRNFPSYYSVTKRILADLKNQEGWKNSKRIVKEIELTLDFISRNRLMRIWQRI